MCQFVWFYPGGVSEDGQAWLIHFLRLPPSRSNRSLPQLFAHELQHDLDHIFPSYPKARAQDEDTEGPAAL